MISAILKEGDPEAPYTQAVVSEALRRSSPGVELTRTITQRCQVGGLVLEPRVNSAVAVGALHHDPDLYPEPSLFRPRRFMDRHFESHEFLPFGGGARRCTGAPFIRPLLAHFSLAVAEGMAMNERM